MGCNPSKADSDLWMKDMRTHYEYICVYVDDLFFESKNPVSLVKQFRLLYKLKGVGKPEFYLGGDYKRNEFNYTKSASTSMNCAQTYITNICKKIESI